MNKDTFYVYCLTKEKKPVYIGCTTNIKQRLYNHNKTKDYDNYIIISSHNDKKEAFASERAIIKYLSIFECDSIINAKYINLKYKNLFL